MFFWIVDLMIPATMVILGLIFRKRPIKKINPICGYRTRRSMLSQKTWDYANCRMAVLWPKWGVLLLIATVISKMFIPISKEYLSLIHTGVGILALIGIVPVIENELKEKFDNRGDARRK